MRPYAFKPDFSSSSSSSNNNNSQCTCNAQQKKLTMQNVQAKKYQTDIAYL